MLIFEGFASCHIENLSLFICSLGSAEETKSEKETAYHYEEFGKIGQDPIFAL